MSLGCIMDPRRAGYNPGHAKRVASRSPDGSKTRKVSRPNYPSEGSSTPKHNNGLSRQASFSSGPSRQSMQPPNTAVDGSRPSAQLLNDLARESTLFVNSPDSLGSRRSQYEDALSGRSTPLSTGGTVARQSLPPAPQTGVVVDSATSPNPIVDTLMNFQYQGSENARLLLSKSQAEARLKRATLEHDNMAHNFAAFPQLKEQKNTTLRLAQDQVKLVSKELDEQMKVQRQLTEAIAGLIQSAEVKPTTTTTTDAMSAMAEEMQLLRAQVTEMKSKSSTSASVEEVQQLRTQVTTVQDAATASTEAVQQLRAQVGRPDTTSASSAAAQEMQHLRGRVVKLETDFTEVKRAANERKNFYGQVPRFASDIAVLKNSSQGYGSDLTSIREDMRRNKVQVDKNYSESKAQLDILSADCARMAKSVAELSSDLKEVTTFAMGAEDEDLKSPLDASSSIGKKLEYALDAVQELKQQLADLRDAVHEDGKEPLEKLVKKSDLLSNNLSTEIRSDDKPPLKQRLSQLEQDVGTMETDLRRLREAPPVVSAPQAVANPAMVPSADLRNIEERLEFIEKTSEDTLNSVAEHLDEHLEPTVAAAVAAAKTEIAGWRAEDGEAISKNLEAINDNLTRVADEMAGVQSRINAVETDFSTNATEAGKTLDNVQLRVGELATALERKSDRTLVMTAIDLLEKSVKELRDVGTSRTPTPGPAHAATSRLSNGNMGAPAVSGSPKVNGATQGALPPGETKDIWEKLDALTYFTNRLKTQYDNLTTDDLVHRMLDQFAAVWPHAKNYETSVKEIKAQLVSFNATLERHKVLIHKAVEDAQSAKTAAADAKTSAYDAKSTADGAKTIAGETSAVTMGYQDDMVEFQLLKVNVRAVEKRVAEYQGKMVALEEVLKPKA